MLPITYISKLQDIGIKYKLLPYQINLLLEYVQQQTRTLKLSKNSRNKNLNLTSLLTKIENQLQHNVPVEYITGYTYFGSNKYLVKHKHCRTYIPAPKTLQLVNKAYLIYEDFLRNKLYKPNRNFAKLKNTHILFLDIGTGSGTILLEIIHRIWGQKNYNHRYKHFHKQTNQTDSQIFDLTGKKLKLTFIGTDISKCALKIAKQNLKNFSASLNNINTSNASSSFVKLKPMSSPQINFINADIVFQQSSLSLHPQIQQAIKDSSLIVITFNKPYIPANYKGKLPPEMQHYPEISLYINNQTTHNWKHFLKILHRAKNKKQIFIIQETSHNPKLSSAKIILHKLK